MYRDTNPHPMSGTPKVPNQATFPFIGEKGPQTHTVSYHGSKFLATNIFKHSSN